MYHSSRLHYKPISPAQDVLNLVSITLLFILFYEYQLIEIDDNHTPSRWLPLSIKRMRSLPFVMLLQSYSFASKCNT